MMASRGCWGTGTLIRWRAASRRGLCGAARVPTVAFVGAPNVGKSTLFNRIVERPRRARATAWEGPSQRAIVCDEPGTTRDRLYGRVEWEGSVLRVVDTAGLFEGSSLAAEAPAEAPAVLELRRCAERQSELALREASALVFVVDATLGVTAVDEMIAERLRALGKPVLLAVNKVDSVDRLALVDEFWELRLGEPMPISAVHGTGTGDLLSAAVGACARAAAAAPPPPAPAPAAAAEPPLLRPLHVALAGRPNAGKSSLLNRLLGAERTAVSATAGTTRDSVSAELLWRGRTLVLVDTAGLRKRATERGGADADGRAQSAAARCVRDATVALCLFDAELGMTQHDISVLQSCIDEGRSVVLCANKWDAASAAGKRWGAVEAELRRALPNLEHVPIVPISAATGEGVERALGKAVEVADGRAGRVPTAELNEALAHALARQPPPRGCSVRHAIQADAEVPTFVLFTRGPPTPSSYLRYLERCIREQIAFAGTPVRLVCKTDAGAQARGAARAAWAGGGGAGAASVSQQRRGRSGPRLGGPGGAGRTRSRELLPARRKR